MELIKNILIFLLIFSLVSGLIGVFYYDNYLKKIACLSVSYTNLIIILIIFSKNNEKASQLFEIITTMLILFSITLAIGIGIISNISKLNNQKSVSRN